MGFGQFLGSAFSVGCLVSPKGAPLVGGQLLACMVRVTGERAEGPPRYPE